MITVARLCCIPVFLWLLFGLDNQSRRPVLLGGLGTTDWVDGYVARRFDQVSELGKVLDPTADRLLFIVVRRRHHHRRQRAAGVQHPGRARARCWCGVTLVVLTLFGMKRFDVSWWGKAGTFGLMFSLPRLPARRGR